MAKVFLTPKVNKGNTRKTLQKTIVALVGILIGLFIVLFAISTFIIGKKSNDEFKKQTAETAVNNAVYTLEGSLTNYNYLTRLLMVNERIVEYLKAEEPTRDQIYEARHGIYEIQNLYSYIDSVYIFRNDGEYVGTERAVYEIDMESEEKDHILEAFGSTVITINGNGMIIKSDEEPLLTLARAVYDINSQKLIGMLFMNVSGQFFEDALIKTSKEDLCIMDRNGVILCGNKELAEYVGLIESKEMTFDEIELGGTRKILAATEGFEPLLVLAACGTTTRTISLSFWIAIFIPFTAFILVITLFYLFLKANIARPIGQLTEAMEQTKSSGWLKKLDARMPDNELGELSESYNSLIEYLNELFNQQIENEKLIQKVEMRVLQEQIKPHFLYNTLETISYMAVQEKAENTHDALEILGNFYRNFLNNGNREITLKRELRITQDYLSLQKLRYGEAFTDCYEIEEETLDCMIPKLILQPLVENAIYHGIRPKGEEGVIRIRTFRQQEDLHIQVYDTGVGMDEEQIQLALAKQTGDSKDPGFGLAGTIHRIRFFCNDPDAVRIRSERGEFTEIEIVIPKVWRNREENSHV